MVVLCGEICNHANPEWEPDSRLLSSSRKSAVFANIAVPHDIANFGKQKPPLDSRIGENFTPLL